jgi:hypothetical protein
VVGGIPGSLGYEEPLPEELPKNCCNFVVSLEIYRPSHFGRGCKYQLDMEIPVVTFAVSLRKSAAVTTVPQTKRAPIRGALFVCYARGETRTRTSPGRNPRLLLGPATCVRTVDPESDLNSILAMLDTIRPGFGPQRPAIAIYVIWCPESIGTSGSVGGFPSLYASLRPAFPGRILCP